jgi:hypothetical protein
MTPEQKILNELFPKKQKIAGPKVPCGHYTYRGTPCYFSASGEALGIPACRYHIKRPRPLPEVHKKEKQNEHK